MNYKILRITLIIIGSIVLVAFILILIRIHSGMQSIKEISGFSDSASSEFNNIFSIESRQKLKCTFTFLSNTRNPVSDFVYDKIFRITVFKIDIINDTSLNSIIKDSRIIIRESSESNYRSDPQCNYSLMIKYGRIMAASTIYFAIEGEPPEIIIKNDSIDARYLENDEFGIKYGQDKEYDLYTEQNNRSFIKKSAAKNLLFIKRNRAVYLLIMCSDSPSYILQKDLLIKLTRAPNLN